MSFTEQITWHDPESREPDDGIDVLVLTPSPSIPVWLGHLDDGQWYYCDGSKVAYKVLAWAELPVGKAPQTEDLDLLFECSFCNGEGVDDLGHECEYCDGEGCD